MAAVVCPSNRCPCAGCAGERARAERIAQGLPERIEDPGFFRRWAQLIRANDRSVEHRRKQPA
jgi:hypothetical protein